MYGEMSICKVLTIAGSDSSGGAGIQADIKTIAAHGMYAMSAITALTAQNTVTVSSVLPIPSAFVGEQLDRIFDDIRPDAVKIGMTVDSETIHMITERLTRYDARNIVVDPVMISTSGRRLLKEDAIAALKLELLPIASLITPNLPEAEALCGYPVDSETDMERAAVFLSETFSTSVLIKGGHLSGKNAPARHAGNALDLLCADGSVARFVSERIDNPNTHGTGCTLSSAIACGLAAGKSIPESIRCAKEYLTGALKSGLDLGKGAGPLNHMFRFSS